MIVNNSFCVYVHTNKINNKKYVGQTCQKPESRWGNQGCGYKGCLLFERAIQKYGWDNFEHEIVYDGLTQDEANYYEEMLIEQYHTTDSDFGYNIRSGGSHMLGLDNPFYGKHHTDETKSKMSQERIGKYTGKNNPNYNNHKLAGKNNPNSKSLKQYTTDGQFIQEFACSGDALKSLGLDCNTSNNITKNCRQMKGTAFGYIWLFSGEEYKLEEKVKNAIYHVPKGADNPQYGRKLSSEHKQKIGLKSAGKSNPSAKSVAQYDLDGNLIKKWDYCKEAAIALGNPQKVSSIVACARGRRKTAYGYIWKYIDETR